MGLAQSCLWMCCMSLSSSLKAKKRHEVCFHHLHLLPMPGSYSQRMHGEGDRNFPKVLGEGKVQ